MPVRVANNAITLIRDGKRIEIEPGQAVQMTKEEIETYKQINPGAFRALESKTVNVIGGDPVVIGEQAEADNTDSSADAEKEDAGDDAGSKNAGTKANVGKGKAGAKASSGAQKDEADL